MEETIVEIAEASPEEGWQPPTLTHQHAQKPHGSQTCADVFFIQYIVSVLLLTAVFVIRYYDASLCERMLTEVGQQTHAPTEACITALIDLLRSNWS